MLVVSRSAFIDTVAGYETFVDRDNSKYTYMVLRAERQPKIDG